MPLITWQVRVPRGTRVKAAVAALAIVAVGLSLLLHLTQSTYVYSPDPSCYLGQAQGLLRGGKLYEDVLSDKPPLSISAHLIAALIAPRSYVALSVILVAVLVLQWGLYVVVLRPPAPAIAAVGVLLLFLPLTHADFNWLSTEHVSNLWIAGLLVLAVRLRLAGRVRQMDCVTCGALAVLAWQTRPNAIVAAVVPTVVMSMMAPSLFAGVIQFCQMAAGGFMAWAGVLLFVSLVGNVETYLYMIFVHPFVYGRTGPPDGLWKLLQIGITCGPLVSNFGLATLGAMYSRMPRTALLIATVGLATCLTSPRDYDHYWMNLLPFMAILYIIGIAYPRESSSASITTAVPSFSVVILCASVLAIVPGVVTATRHACRNANRLQMQQFVEVFESLAPAGTRLAVIGPIPLEFLTVTSSMKPAHPMWTAWVLERPLEVASLYAPAKTIVQEYMANPPDMVIICQPWIQWRINRVAEDPTHAAAPIVALANWVESGGQYPVKRTVGHFRIYQ